MVGFQLENRKVEIKAICVSYRGRIAELWERLQIPQEETLAEHMQSSSKRNMDYVSAQTPLFDTTVLNGSYNVY